MLSIGASVCSIFRPRANQTPSVPTAAVFITQDGRDAVISIVRASGFPTTVTATLTALTLDGVDVLGSVTGSGPWRYTVPDDGSTRTVVASGTVTNTEGTSPVAQGSLDVPTDWFAPSAATSNFRFEDYHVVRFSGITGNPTPATFIIDSYTLDGVDISGNVVLDAPNNQFEYTPPPSASDQTIAWSVRLSNGVAPDVSYSGSYVFLADLSAPSVTASDALAGRTLTITVDSLTGDPAPSVSLTTLTLDAVDVSGDATGTGPWQYVVPSDAAAQTVAWEVTATNSVGSDTASGSAVVPANITAPGAYTAPDWTAAAGGNGEIVINPGTDPALNNGTLIRREYRIDGGAAVSMALTDPFTATGIAAGSRDVQIRAVNEAGAGAWSDTKAVTVTEAASAPTVSIDAFNDGTDTATITCDQDCDLDWALVSGVTWSYSGGVFSGADVLESGSAGSFTVAGGAQAFTPTYTNASATATTLVIGATNANGDDTDTTAFTANIVPVISGVPTIAGTETEGQTLTATAATVAEGVPTPTRTWQWERSGTPISGATSSTYTLAAADVGETLTVVQTETNTHGADTAESAATGVIASAGGGGVTPVYVTSAVDTGTFGEFKTFTSLIPDADTFLVVFTGSMGGADTQAMTLSGPNISGGANVADVETGVGSAYAGAWLITSTGASDVTIDGNDFTMNECAAHVYRVTGGVSVASDSAAGELAETAVSIASAPAGAAIVAAHCNTDTTGAADTTTWDVGDLSGQQDYLDTRSSTASLANGTTQTISTTPAMSNANPGAPWATIIVSITDT